MAGPIPCVIELKYGSQRNKPASRTSTACHPCRKRKTKCDGQRPVCQTCEEDHLDCFYKTKELLVSEDANFEVNERFDGLEHKIRNVLARQTTNNEQLDRMQSVLKSLSSKRARADRQFWFDGPTEERPQKSARYSRDHTFPHTEFRPPQVQNQPTSLSPRLNFRQALCWPVVARLLSINCDRTCGWNYQCSRKPHRADLSDSASFDSRSSQWEVNSAAQESHPAAKTGRRLLPFEGRDQFFSVTYDHFRYSENIDFSTLLSSYLRQVHSRRPFLEIPVLRKSISSFEEDVIFKRQKCWGSADGLAKWKNFKSAKAGLQSAENERGLENSESDRLASIQRMAMQDATVLFVLGLGELCRFRETTKKSGSGPYSSISTTQNHAGNNTNVRYRASEPDWSQQACLDDAAQTDTSGETMQVYPGSTYFLQANALLEMVGNDPCLWYVHSNLLASLYLILVGRTDRSRFHLTRARNACQALHDTLKDHSQPLDQSSIALLHLAFWNCSQINSDLLTETCLTFHHYSVDDSVRYGELTLICKHPSIIESIGEDVLRSFLDEVYLQKILDDARNELYDPSPAKATAPPLGLIKALNCNLASWRRRFWTQSNNFDNTQVGPTEVSETIYHTAEYVINRPALQYYLELSASQRKFGSTQCCFDDYPNQSLLLELSKICVNAAVKDIEHSCRIRTAVQFSVVHTMHRLFQEMIVVVAVFSSGDSQLSKLLDKATVNRLLENTLTTLRADQSLPAVLHDDIEILESLRFST